MQSLVQVQRIAGGIPEGDGGRNGVQQDRDEFVLLRLGDVVLPGRAVPAGKDGLSKEKRGVLQGVRYRR